MLLIGRQITAAEVLASSGLALGGFRESVTLLWKRIPRAFPIRAPFVRYFCWLAMGSKESSLAGGSDRLAVTPHRREIIRAGVKSVFVPPIISSFHASQACAADYSCYGVATFAKPLEIRSRAVRA